MKAPAYHPYRPYAITWVVLMLMVVAEIIVARVFGWSNLAPFFGIAMAAIVAMIFMDLHRSNNLTRIFAMAGVFWLIILLGLVIVDPVTRVQVLAPQQTLDWRMSPVGPGGQ